MRKKRLCQVAAFCLGLLSFKMEPSVWERPSLFQGSTAEVKSLSCICAVLPRLCSIVEFQRTWHIFRSWKSTDRHHGSKDSHTSLRQKPTRMDWIAREGPRQQILYFIYGKPCHCCQVSCVPRESPLFDPELHVSLAYLLHASLVCHAEAKLSVSRLGDAL